jgi:phosphatidylglycerophosphatase A
MKSSFACDGKFQRLRKLKVLNKKGSRYLGIIDPLRQRQKDSQYRGECVNRGVMGRLAVILSSGLGVGYVPAAPGTFGTLWGVLLFYLTRHLPFPWYLAGTLLFFAFAVGVAHAAEKSLGAHDSSIIIIDEIVGYLVTVVGFSFSWPIALAGFLLFRFFDILKPFPIRWADRRIPGGLGVVVDDVLAGIFANLLLRLGIYLWQHFGGQ